MKTSSAAVLALVLVGCVEPVQYGGPIHVDHAGVEARLRRVCGVTEQTLGCASLAPAEGPTSTDAGSVLDAAGQEPGPPDAGQLG